MPELPDITVYVDALRTRVVGRRLDRLRLLSPFVLRSVDPPTSAVEGRTVAGVRRIGKRIVLAFPDEVFAVVHLMIAGRLRWRDAPAARAEGASAPPERARARAGPREHTRKAALPAVKNILAAFEFENGTLFFTEASSRKRASLTLVRGAGALAAVDPGGLEPLEASLDEFRAALVRENHTLKRALTDPRLFSGIGNAYSDEILHAAKLSPLKLTRALSEADATRLYDATRATLTVWIAHLREELGGAFPETVTAFRPEMAVHGRFRQPCPVCGAPVQRIVYAENECNYCARCQTGGRLLADRSLSRLLGEDWPARLEEL